jgi:curli production assembly/transport component CsgG
MINKLIYFSVILLFLVSCGARIKQPFKTEEARIGENTTPENEILKGVEPMEPIVVGVYKFRDQTGQYKQVENGTSWSTAVTQGATTILLKSLEDSKWFVPIERENISNLLNERQIIRSTRKQYDAQGKVANEADILPPLLFAGIILEGGVISYDSNIVTGGMGARYFGTGASSKYREDRITIYLRAVSTSNGKILKTVYISKTILSQAISASVFKYVDVKKLLEVEVGITQNEPKQLAVKEAVDKAVEDLIIEGIIDGLWKPKGGEKIASRVALAYHNEVEQAKKTKLYQREFEDRRSKNSFGFVIGGTLMDGDYSNSDLGYNLKLNYKHVMNNPHLAFDIEGGMMELDKKNVSIEDYAFTLDGNLEYIFLPYENITPFVYGGAGAIADQSFNSIDFKIQYGLGVEYLPVDYLGLRLYGEHNITFTDNLDGLVQGKRYDYFWRFGLGINFYFGN